MINSSRKYNHCKSVHFAEFQGYDIVETLLYLPSVLKIHCVFVLFSDTDSDPFEVNSYVSETDDYSSDEESVNAGNSLALTYQPKHILLLKL